MLRETIEQIFEAELEDQIGYPKGEKSEDISNSRNRFSTKMLKSKAGKNPNGFSYVLLSPIAKIEQIIEI